MPRILSLDDELGMVELLRLILERAGYEHVGTTDHDTALSILRSEPIDLFTQDLMRPDMDGWEFYELMQSDEKLREIPVLIISANAQGIEGMLSPRPHEADGYIIKPFGPQELMAEVQRILRLYAGPLSTEEERAQGRVRRETILRRRAQLRDEMIRRSVQLVQEIASHFPNVKLDEHNVFIHGQRGEYQVSLDTGQTRLLPNKRLCLVPGYSGYFGPNVCLPFEDIDIRVQTVVSAISMLAADQDIRDEAILRQLK
jgi:DNA-binding response OmpR family regulator